jgi:S-DNA-T family DNA segregation ATPase FtsK/SpoIIIE
VASDTSLLHRLPATGPVLLVVDDADTLDDVDGALAALAAGSRPDTWMMAAGRPETLRQTYGHWTTVVRRSRIGVVLAGGSELDGDLLGVLLPRRLPVPARPGLAWMVVDHESRLVQVALDEVAAAAPQRSHA